jgi:hypothetical protein
MSASFKVLVDPNLLRHICSFQQGHPIEYWLRNIDKVCKHGYVNILKSASPPVTHFNVDNLWAAIKNGHLPCASYMLDVCPSLKNDFNGTAAPQWEPNVYCYYPMNSRLYYGVSSFAMFAWLADTLELPLPEDLVDRSARAASFMRRRLCDDNISRL